MFIRSVIAAAFLANVLIWTNAYADESYRCQFEAAWTVALVEAVLDWDIRTATTLLEWNKAIFGRFDVAAAYVTRELEETNEFLLLNDERRALFVNRIRWTSYLACKVR